MDVPFKSIKYNNKSKPGLWKRRGRIRISNDVNFPLHSLLTVPEDTSAGMTHLSPSYSLFPVVFILN